MANPTNLDELQFGINYEIAQGDPTDPMVDWDVMSVVSGTGQSGLDQAQSQYEQIKAAIDSGMQPSVRRVDVVYAPEVAWNVWEQPQEESNGPVQDDSGSTGGTA